MIVNNVYYTHIQSQSNIKIFYDGIKSNTKSKIVNEGDFSLFSTRRTCANGDACVMWNGPVIHFTKNRDKRDEYQLIFILTRIVYWQWSMRLVGEIEWMVLLYFLIAYVDSIPDLLLFLGEISRRLELKGSPVCSCTCLSNERTSDSSFEENDLSWGRVCSRSYRAPGLFSWLWRLYLIYREAGPAQR